MPVPARITRPLLLVLGIFVQAAAENRKLHGWEVKKRAHLSGATTYRMFDRLEDAGWITGEWDTSDLDPAKPTRRYYTLTPTGVAEARALLAERMPEALRRMTNPAPAPRAVPGLSGVIDPRLSGGTT
jgi:PadR family transcriptional regulator, regulatory protein PadR